MPANTTAFIDSQVVLQCKVQSEGVPTIKWFQKQDTTMNISLEDDEVVEFFKNTYKHLESAGEKIVSDNIYLSKLILNRVTHSDAGYYVCVAINYRGYKFREAYVDVIYPEELDITSSSLGTKELLLLFLIPIGLALLPVSLWLCYYIYRKTREKTIGQTSRMESATRKRKRNDRNRKYSVICENDVYL